VIISINNRYSDVTLEMCKTVSY